MARNAFLRLSKGWWNVHMWWEFRFLGGIIPTLDDWLHTTLYTYVVPAMVILPFVVGAVFGAFAGFMTFIALMGVGYTLHLLRMALFFLFR